MRVNSYQRSLLTVGCIVACICGCATTSIKSLFSNQSIDKVVSEEELVVPLVIWYESFPAAMQESATTGKPILADFTGSDWCHWCQKLKQDVFATREFKRWAKENVVLVELDFPRRNSQSQDIKQQNSELAQRYGIKGYPTVLLLDSQGNVLGRMGYMDQPTAWIEQAESQLMQSTAKQGFAGSVQ